MTQRHRSWSELQGDDEGFPCLVVGNGLSRGGMGQTISSFQDIGPVIGCNSCWRDETWYPDWLVCFDKQQVKLALAETELRVLAPWRSQQRQEHQLEGEYWLRFGSRLWAIDPYDDRIPTSNHNRRAELPEGWSPQGKALGNLSGLLAFQFAVILGCNPIYLLGMDVSGRVEADGRVLLSACDPSWEGYGNHQVTEQHCDEVSGALVPRGWHNTRRFWRLLIEWAREIGIDVHRLTEHGSLDFVDVASPSDGIAFPHLRLPDEHRRNRFQL